MAYLWNDSQKWRVPLDYFQKRPRFRPFYIPYTDYPVKVMDDDGNELRNAVLDRTTGSVFVPAATPTSDTQPQP